MALNKLKRLGVNIATVKLSVLKEDSNTLLEVAPDTKIKGRII